MSQKTIAWYAIACILSHTTLHAADTLTTVQARLKEAATKEATVIRCQRTESPTSVTAPEIELLTRLQKTHERTFHHGDILKTFDAELASMDAATKKGGRISVPRLIARHQLKLRLTPPSKWNSVVKSLYTLYYELYSHAARSTAELDPTKAKIIARLATQRAIKQASPMRYDAYCMFINAQDFASLLVAHKIEHPEVEGAELIQVGSEITPKSETFRLIYEDFENAAGQLADLDKSLYLGDMQVPARDAYLWFLNRTGQTESEIRTW